MLWKQPVRSSNTDSWSMNPALILIHMVHLMLRLWLNVCIDTAVDTGTAVYI